MSALLKWANEFIVTPWPYAIWMVCMAYLAFNNWRERKRWRKKHAEESQYAHCRCGQRMSEWFTNGGLMWHPVAARGCGWISPWADHEDYRIERDAGNHEGPYCLPFLFGGLSASRNAVKQFIFPLLSTLGFR